MSFIAAIDWSRPLAPYRALGERLAREVAAGVLAAHDAAVPQLAAGPLRFAPQTELPDGEAYEAYIHRMASVPRATTCTTSSTAWSGCTSRRSSGASTKSRPKRSPAAASAQRAVRCAMQRRSSTRTPR